MGATPAHAYTRTRVHAQIVNACRGCGGRSCLLSNTYCLCRMVYRRAVPLCATQHLASFRGCRRDGRTSRTDGTTCGCTPAARPIVEAKVADHLIGVRVYRLQSRCIRRHRGSRDSDSAAYRSAHRACRASARKGDCMPDLDVIFRQRQQSECRA